MERATHDASTISALCEDAYARGPPLRTPQDAHAAAAPTPQHCGPDHAAAAVRSSRSPLDARAATAAPRAQGDRAASAPSQILHRTLILLLLRHHHTQQGILVQMLCHRKHAQQRMLTQMLLSSFTRLRASDDLKTTRGRSQCYLICSNASRIAIAGQSRGSLCPRIGATNSHHTIQISSV